jgi:hypothetical protein
MGEPDRVGEQLLTVDLDRPGLGVVGTLLGDDEVEVPGQQGRDGLLGLGLGVRVGRTRRPTGSSSATLAKEA